ncbi:MAG: 3,4-dihydroxy-2-butanone-4-phosphate synthase [Pseudomonadota bacterium]
MPIAPVEEAIAAYKRGDIVIIVDDEDRENEGDLAIAADFVTAEKVNFFAKEGRGLICCAMAPSLIDRLDLPLMVEQEKNQSGFGTPFTVSVEASQGVTTGISAHDRAHTIKTLINPASTPKDIVTPGHMFPLRARENGVLERDGQTEASVDLSILAGLTPASMICEVMNDDGSMARLRDLEQFAERHDFLITSVAALTEYRRALATSDLRATG